MHRQSTTDLDIVQAEYDAGNLSWRDVQITQDALMPRCLIHNRPGKGFFGKEPICVVCIETRAAAIVEASRKNRA